VPGKGWTSVGWLQPDEARAKARAAARAALAERLALAVEPDLLPDDVVAEPGAEVVLQTVAQRDQHVLDAAVRDELGEELAALGTFVVAKEVTNHVQGEVTGEVKYRVIEQVGDKLFHRDTSRGLLGKKTGLLISRINSRRKG
jgi:hypothetical protein